MPMKTINKALAIAGVTASVAAASFIGLGAASAATTSSTSNNPMSSLVVAISERFDLKTSDVQAVFDEQRTAMEAERDAEVKTELTLLVKDGKLTQAQSDAITTKRDQLEKERYANRTGDQPSTKTNAERITEMETRKTELDTWLKDQGVDTQYAYLVMGGGRGHGSSGRGGQNPS